MKMEEGSRQSFFRFQSITTYKSLRTIFTGMSVQDILEKKKQNNWNCQYPWNYV